MLFYPSISFTLATASLTAAQLAGYATQNGGTTGGAGGTTTTVSAAAAFQTAVKTVKPITVFLTAPVHLSSQTSVASDTTIIGVGPEAILTGVGLKISGQKNIIIRNLIINKVTDNDGITITSSTNIWIDHNEFFSDLTHGPDFYDGQVDVNHASDFITVSWNFFHDHFKSSLVGGDPENGSEDTGHFHITYHHNYWKNVHTRTPALRFSHAHVYNNYYENLFSQGIHTRSLGQVLVEGNVFVNSTEPLSTYGFVIPDDSPNSGPAGDFEDDGFANLGAANDWGTGKINITRTGDFTSVPYSYSLTALASVKAAVVAGAGVGKI
ncbi:polysaccharide lyase family 1 protein [Mycena vulgaris]|nr:polysaccharide lyase family 1 protein [Mycena vulgaris]